MAIAVADAVRQPFTHRSAYLPFSTTDAGRHSYSWHSELVGKAQLETARVPGCHIELYVARAFIGPTDSQPLVEVAITGSSVPYGESCIQNSMQRRRRLDRVKE